MLTHAGRSQYLAKHKGEDRATRDRREYNRTYHAANKEKNMMLVRKWRAANRETYNEIKRKWYAANKEKVRMRRRKYKATNIEKHKRAGKTAEAEQRCGSQSSSSPIQCAGSPGKVAGMRYTRPSNRTNYQSAHPCSDRFMIRLPAKFDLAAP